MTQLIELPFGSIVQFERAGDLVIELTTDRLLRFASTQRG